MVYSTDGAKWKAYQFSDPFAAGSFFVCNKINKSFCRPDCDVRPVTNLKSEIKFVTLGQEALNYGYRACEHCEPLNMPSINVKLLVDCVATINKQIGFLPPLMDEDEDINNEKIKENILESKKTNEEHILQAIGGRRSSVPVANYDGRYSKDYENTSLSKNDCDHYRLVDLACRHLALAAAMNIFQPASAKGPKVQETSPTGSASRKRRRRGGVLGFKELAAKSKLSAWHFHRVFKSVTGLTPKTYGDKCWEFIKNYKSSGDFSVMAPHNQSVPSYENTSLTPNSNEGEYLTSSLTSPEMSPAAKRAKISSGSGVKRGGEKVARFELASPPKTAEEPSTTKEGLILPNQPVSNNAGSLPEVSLYGLSSPGLNSDHAKVGGHVDYSVPQLASFDFNSSETMFNNFDLFENDSGAGLGHQDAEFSYSRAFSAPNLTKFNANKPSTLFSHARQPENADIDENAASTLLESPLIGDMPFGLGDVMHSLPNINGADFGGTLLNDGTDLSSLIQETGVSSLNPLNDESNLAGIGAVEYEQNPTNLGFPSEILSANNVL